MRYARVLWAMGALALAVVISVLLVRTPAAHAVDRKDCSDFRTQKRAQRWFNHHHPRRDPSHLDADNDLIPCEDNPCPCSRRWHRQHGKVAAAKPVYFNDYNSPPAIEPRRLDIVVG